MEKKQDLREIVASMRRLRVQVQSTAELSAGRSGWRRVTAQLSLVDKRLEEIVEALERFAPQPE
jgi:hypothetical protein